MKELDFNDMENYRGGGWFTENHSTGEHATCASIGLMTGLGFSFLTPLGGALMGGTATLICYLQT
jgi:hypothetical protein